MQVLITGLALALLALVVGLLALPLLAAHFHWYEPFSLIDKFVGNGIMLLILGCLFAGGLANAPNRPR